MNLVEVVCQYTLQSVQWLLRIRDESVGFGFYMSIENLVISRSPKLRGNDIHALLTDTINAPGGGGAYPGCTHVFSTTGIQYSTVQRISTRIWSRRGVCREEITVKVSDVGDPPHTDSYLCGQSGGHV